MLNQYLSTISSLNTRKAYGRDIQRFLDWVAESGLELGALRARHFVAFRAEMQSEEADEGVARFSDASINRTLSAVREYLRYLVVEEKIPGPVFAEASALKSLKVEHTLVKPFTAAEVDALRAQPNLAEREGCRDLALMELLLASGLRVSEAVGLEVADLSFSTGGSPHRLRVLGKGRKERIAFFNDQAAAAILYYLSLRGNPNGPVFVNAAGEPLSPRWVQARFAEYAEQAGVADGANPHRWRHTFATNFLDATGDIDALAKLLGHSDVRVTARTYTPLAVGRLEPVYQQAQTQSGGLLATTQVMV